MVFVASLAVKYHHTSFGITPQMLQASRDFDQREPRTETRTKYARDRSECCKYTMMVKATGFSREIGCLEHVAWHEKNNGGTRSHCKEHLVVEKNAILALSQTKNKTFINAARSSGQGMSCQRSKVLQSSNVCRLYRACDTAWLRSRGTTCRNKSSSAEPRALQAACLNQ